MGGMAIMIIGFGILVLTTVGMAVVEWILYVKKKRIRELTYHVYQ